MLSLKDVECGYPSLVDGEPDKIIVRNISRSVEVPVLVVGRRVPRGGSLLSAGVVAKLANGECPMFALLREVAAAQPQALSHPPPVALFQAFGASSLDFVVRLWTDDPAWPAVRSEALVAIHARLAAAGIEIPFPQQDLHLKSVAPDAARALGAARAE